MTTEEGEQSVLGRHHPPEDINRCKCGYKAALQRYEIFFWVECNRKECWHGPVVRRRDKAIMAWNSVMKRSKNV